jgi:hypothetical protein
MHAQINLPQPDYYLRRFSALALDGGGLPAPNPVVEVPVSRPKKYFSEAQPQTALFSSTLVRYSENKIQIIIIAI